jgi:small subunit ribosomal protein S6
MGVLHFNATSKKVKTKGLLVFLQKKRTFAPAFNGAFFTIYHNSLIMRHYEVTFIVDPVLSGDEVQATAQHIQNDLTQFGANIVAVDEIGLRQLAYQINRRSSGYYFCTEFACEAADWIGKFELNLQRNEKLLRFLTVKLDKYGVKYNDDKRNGRIGLRKKAEAEAAAAAARAEETEVIDLDADTPAAEA